MKPLTTEPPLDPPDEYNVFEDEDDHDCKATVDGG